MLLVYYYRDVIMFTVYGKINMMMMIPLWVELKLNRNRFAIQIYTENWKVKKDHFHTLYPIECLAHTVRNIGTRKLGNEHESFELYELYL